MLMIDPPSLSSAIRRPVARLVSQTPLRLVSTTWSQSASSCSRAGFVEVTQTKVSILTDMAMSDTEVDEAAAEEAVSRAKEALQNKDLNSEEVSEIEGAIARSLAQLRFKKRRRSH